MKHLIALSSALLITTLAFAAPAAFAADKPKVVNINEAGAAELALLPRVGPALSLRIVEFREANGKFKQAEDLMLVRGIGEKTFALMEDFVSVSGETTLSEKVRVSQIRPKEEPAESSDG